METKLTASMPMEPVMEGIFDYKGLLIRGYNPQWFHESAIYTTESQHCSVIARTLTDVL